MNEEEKKAIEIVKKIKNMKFNVTSSFYSSGTISLSIEEKEAIETVLKLISKLRKENKGKDKQIDELIKYIDNNNYVDSEECQFQYDFKIKECIGKGDCKDCIKQYFEKQEKEKGE